MTKKNVELFPCAGGMAEGFRRAGVDFDLAVELMPDHCESYAQNLGHRPMNMDARDFLRMLEMGVVQMECRLLVADPPCTPWSHAGKRQGTSDDRDMLVETCKIIAALQPDVYLIGNVPGLDDSKNLHVVQKYIGGLSKLGYCTADFIRLDAADYGVPQHRVRPFWFGHKIGTPCISWPEPTHGDPTIYASSQGLLPIVRALKPWVSCRQALGHLSAEELGRAVKVARHRGQNGKQHGSVAEKPARVVGATNLSDGNVLAIPREQITIRDADHAMSSPDSPAHTLTKNTHSDGAVIVFNRKHPHADADAPAPTLGAKQRGQGANVVAFNSKHQPADADAPATTIRGGGEGHSAPALVIVTTPNHAGHDVNGPAGTIRAGGGGGANLLLHEPSKKKKRGGSTQGSQSERVGDANRPATTVQAREDRVETGSIVLEWPWERPSTTVTGRAGLPPPGHHDENFAILSLPDAVIISQKAATILQGFPEDWVFHGKTKKARWSQIGQAMPPPLAHAVGTSVRQQIEKAEAAEVFDTPLGRVKVVRPKAKRKSKA